MKIALVDAKAVTSKTLKAEDYTDKKYPWRDKNKAYTCDGCDLINNECEWAYDGYNTDGDCLAEK